MDTIFMRQRQISQLEKDIAVARFIVDAAGPDAMRTYRDGGDGWTALELSQFGFKPFGAGERAGLQCIALQHQGTRLFPIAGLGMDAGHHRGELWLEASGGEAQAIPPYLTHRLRHCPPAHQRCPVWQWWTKLNQAVFQ